jgi:hypothetical protein
MALGTEDAMNSAVGSVTFGPATQQ